MKNAKILILRIKIFLINKKIKYIIFRMKINNFIMKKCLQIAINAAKKMENRKISHIK